MSVTKKILLGNLDKTREVNYSELARATGITKGGVWYYLNQRDQFPAHNWLKLLWSFGGVEITNGGALIKMSPATVKQLKRELKGITVNEYYHD